MDIKRNELTARNFPTAEEDALAAPPATRYSGPESAYRLAFTLYSPSRPRLPRASAPCLGGSKKARTAGAVPAMTGNAHVFDFFHSS